MMTDYEENKLKNQVDELNAEIQKKLQEKTAIENIIKENTVTKFILVIPIKLKDRLEQMAKEKRTYKSIIVRDAIESYLIENEY